MRKYTTLLFFIFGTCQFLYAQNVGIGTTNPNAALHIKRDFEALRLEGNIPYMTFYNNFGTLKGFVQNNGDNIYIGTAAGNPGGLLQFYTNGAPVVALNAAGNVGIGTTNPTNKLQINGPATGFTDYDFVIGRNAQVMSIYQGPNFTNLASTVNFSINPGNGTGNVGINAGNPANKLQIGSVGATTFNGNDLAIGNGTNAMVVYQSNTSTLLASSTDIILMPRNNGQGRVGINTLTPIASLDVRDYVELTNRFYDYLNYGSAVSGLGRCNCNTGISIYAARGVYAQEFDAFSDARIKNINGKSNTTADLETVNQLEVTDYTLKDKIQSGDRIYKKVIAQQVEKVYPQVVSKHVDFIPNVYQVTSNIEKTANGYLFTFAGNHNISKTAKKLRVLLAEGQGMEQFDIISIPADNKVEIKATALKTDKAFVYGEEVDDFRTVDYEGLTTLNISATQELSKLVKKQQEAIDMLTEEIKKMKEKSIVAMR